MFQMPVIEVPTNLPNIRCDLPIQAFAVCSLQASIAKLYCNCSLSYGGTSSHFSMLWIIYQTARGKWEYVRAEIESMFQLGRPVLVGTTR